MNHQELTDLCTKRDALKTLIPLWRGDTDVLKKALKETEEKISEAIK